MGYSTELYHHGVKGQRWGIRRYQNPDGSLTPAGKQRYLNSDGSYNSKYKKEIGSKSSNSGSNSKGSTSTRKKVAIAAAVTGAVAATAAISVVAMKKTGTDVKIAQSIYNKSRDISLKTARNQALNNNAFQFNAEYKNMRSNMRRDQLQGLKNNVRRGAANTAMGPAQKINSLSRNMATNRARNQALNNNAFQFNAEYKNMRSNMRRDQLQGLKNNVRRGAANTAMGPAASIYKTSRKIATSPKADAARTNAIKAANTVKYIKQRRKQKW